ncbi:holin [Erwinia sp. CPCC 100877]|nr:holin [Erwinia sp. CPCC 100877]
MANINTTLDWMRQRKGVVRYSMDHRLGPYSYDCSSSVYNALITGGFLPTNTSIGNTETLFNDLERNEWELVQPVNGNYPAKKGDVFIWGKRGYTLGAAGHTGLFIDDNDNIIHCNAGHDGISVNNHDVIWSYNGCPAITIYRYAANNGTDKPSTLKPQPTKRRYGYRVDDVKQINGMWQIRCNSLAPAGFNWTDNGINATDVDMINASTGATLSDQETIEPGMYFAFNESRVCDSGVIVSDHGYNYRKFNFAQPTGAVWLVRDSKQQLVYG